MKKLLSFALVLIMTLALAVPSMAGSAATGPDTATLEGVGFHCNHGGNGNGKTDVYKISEGKSYDKKGNIVGVDTGNKFKFDFVRVDETTWKLVSEDYACVVCDNNIWASYSNKSGVPNGKNIQVNPYTPPTPPEDDTIYGLLSILKTVNGQPLAAWVEENGYDLYEIINGMNFTAYLLDGENGNHVIPEVSFSGEVTLTGDIIFGEGKDLPVGWYEVVEEISGTAANYFVGEGKSEVYYVGETGVSSEIVNFVSGGLNGETQIGTIVYHDGTGVEYKLPHVWNTALASQRAFQKLMDMGAQWIWDREDTYVYGVSGTTYSETFKVSLTEAIDAKINFAADNVALIYVNGKLAAFTEVALADRGVAIGDDYDVMVLDKLTHDIFDGRWDEGWVHAYEATISLNKGDNEIIIIAANSSSTGHYDENGNFIKGSTGTDNDVYNYTNNPCGVIFGFEIPGATFDNEPKDINFYGDVTITAEVELYNDVENYIPVYVPETESNTTETLVSKWNHQAPKNGQATVKIDLDRAMDGYEIEIADSSPNNNGIGYYYNVKIVENQLVVSFNDDLVNADVGIALGTSINFWNNGHPENGKNGIGVQGTLGEKTNKYSLIAPLPESDDVYLFLHIAGGITWYTGNMIFDQWEFCCSEIIKCDICDAPVLTAKIYNSEGELIGEEALTGLSNEASFNGLPYGDYTVELYNGDILLKTQEVTIDENVDNGSVDFGIISFSCECETIKNTNFSSPHEH